MHPEHAAALASFAQQYRDARLNEGWRPFRPDELLNLPDGSPPGYPRLYWEVRRQTYRVLAAHLAGEGPPPEAGAAADLGAGVGWLSHRLTNLGYRTVAVEAMLDEAFGLGAARVYRERSAARFLPVHGDLEHPPLRRGQFGLILYNASLHYARNLAAALHRAVEALRPEGRVIVLDTPIASRPGPGSRLGDRHPSRQELETAFLAVGLRPRWIPVRRSLRWWIYRAKAWLKGDPSFSFPILLGYRT
jgi:SAM-dependent methyltransferase